MKMAQNFITQRAGHSEMYLITHCIMSIKMDTSTCHLVSVRGPSNSNSAWLQGLRHILWDQRVSGQTPSISLLAQCQGHPAASYATLLHCVMGPNQPELWVPLTFYQTSSQRVHLCHLWVQYHLALGLC